MDIVLKKIVQQARKDPSVVAVAIFGSSARGEEYHDIDVCIFLKPNKYTENKLSQKKLAYASEQEKYDVQIFQQLPVYIRERVFNEAQFIFCKDEDQLYDLFFAMEREMEHFRPIYESYLEAVESG